MRRLVWMGFIVAAVLAGCTGGRDENAGVATITPAATARLLNGDTSVIFLDVRTLKEYDSDAGHLKGALLIPVDSLEGHLNDLAPYKAKTIIAYCRTGHRSGRAQKILTAHGYRALSVSGGITEWNKEHLPVVKEPH
jgi:rhodanese-related sulfurtransferase